MEGLLQLVPPWVLRAPLVRRTVDTWFLPWARRRVAELDHADLARRQDHTLLGLVHQARGTPFGRDHDFARIRTPQDYRRLVPLRTPAQIWQEYWEPSLADRAGARWSDSSPSPDGEGARHTAPTRAAVTGSLRTAQQNALPTALALVSHVRPQSRLFGGNLLFLDGYQGGLRPAADPAGQDGRRFTPSWLLPPHLRPYGLPLPILESRGRRDEAPAFVLPLAALPMACIAGSAERVLRLLAALRKLAGRERLPDPYQQLTAILYVRGSASPDAARLARELPAAAPPGPLLLETWFEGKRLIAVQDPRYGLLRLLPDVGVYFEFVPADELGKPQPSRHGLAEVRPGVPYALALTSATGLWACLVGRIVRFERRDAPLVRLEPMQVAFRQPAPLPAVKAPTPDHPFPVPPPRPRSDGSPAGPRGTRVRILS